MRTRSAKIKLAELDETIALCERSLGGSAGAAARSDARRAPLNFTTTVIEPFHRRYLTFEGAQVEGMWNEDAAGKARASSDTTRAPTAEFSKPVPASQPYSQPYWLVKPPYRRRLTSRRPDADRAARYAAGRAGAGEAYRGGTPFELVRPGAPPLCRPRAGRTRAAAPGGARRWRSIFPMRMAIFPTAATRKVQVSVQANIAKAAGELRLDPPAGWKVEPASQPFQIAVSGEQQEMNFKVTPPAGETTAPLQAVATVGGREIASGMDVIAYPHIPPQAIFPPPRSGWCGRTSR